MAAFHPAAGRIINGGERGGGGVGKIKQRHDDDHDAKNNFDANAKEVAEDHLDDEIESDFSSDYDQPYHETASNWYTRHARRRARRMAGISSSSSSSSSGSDCSSVESEDRFFNGDSNDKMQKGWDKQKAMERAKRSANRPFSKWLSSYPLVAAHCCLSPIVSTENNAANNNFYGIPGFNNPNPNNNNNCNTNLILPRDEETKRLRRILRRLRRKQKEFQVKFMNNTNSNSGLESTTTAEEQINSSSSYYQSSNALSVEQMMRINSETAETENDRYAIHSFIPQGTGISFIDEVLARDSSLLRYNNKPAQDDNDKKEQKTKSRLVLELVSS